MNRICILGKDGDVQTGIKGMHCKLFWANSSHRGESGHFTLGMFTLFGHSWIQKTQPEGNLLGIFMHNNV